MRQRCMPAAADGPAPGRVQDRRCGVLGERAVAAWLCTAGFWVYPRGSLVCWHGCCTGLAGHICRPANGPPLHVAVMKMTVKVVAAASTTTCYCCCAVPPAEWHDVPCYIACSMHCCCCVVLLGWGAAVHPPHAGQGAAIQLPPAWNQLSELEPLSCVLVCVCLLCVCWVDVWSPCSCCLY